MPFVVTLLAAIAALCAWSYRNRETQLERMFGGRHVVDVVRNAESVVAYRLEPLPPGMGEQQVKISDFPTVGGLVDIPGPIVVNLIAALTSPDTYMWDSAKSCLPVYGVRLAFARANERVDVLLCFECNILLIGYNGTVLGGEDFDFSRAEFVRAAKRLFPRDAGIQALSE